MKAEALIRQARAARVQSDRELWESIHGPSRRTADDVIRRCRELQAEAKALRESLDAARAPRAIAPPPPPPPPGPPPAVRRDGGLVPALGLEDGDTFASAIARISVGVVAEFVVWGLLSAAGLA